MKRWLFVMQGGLEPSRTIGPVHTPAAERKSILRLLREFPDLLAEEGYDTLHWIELQKGRPVVGSYAAGPMEELRAQIQPSASRATHAPLSPIASLHPKTQST